MPQMEFADYAPQLIWLAITFITLYVLMARVALPRIADVLEQRQLRMANDLEQAESLRDEATKALEAYEATMAEARSKAHEIALEARNQIAEEAEKRRAAFEADVTDPAWDAPIEGPRRATAALRAGDTAELGTAMDRSFDARQSVVALDPAHVEMIDAARAAGGAANYAGSGGAIVVLAADDETGRRARSALGRLGCGIIDVALGRHPHQLLFSLSSFLPGIRRQPSDCLYPIPVVILSRWV